LKLDSPLRTRRLVLRTLTAADADDRYLGWMRDSEINQFLESRFAEHSLTSLEKFIESCNAGADELLLGICLTNGRHIGNIKLGLVNRHHQNAAVGLLIGERDCWGRGYGSEAIIGVTAHAFGSLDLQKLYAGCYASNVGSARAFVKAGWAEEGRSKGHWLSHGTREDNVQFGITRSEWVTNPD
jgi:RimJ/RimL family protein N-acetyltransferase